MKKTQRGFTLLELLVVVTIIGMLSSVVLASVSAARIKARDARRVSDLKQLQLALQLYYGENSAYPVATQYSSSEPSSSAFYVNPAGFVPGLAPTYIATLPRDPNGGISSLCGSPYRHEYVYFSPDGTNYKLLSHCGPEGAWTSTHATYDPLRPTWGWMICSGEPACSSW